MFLKRVEMQNFKSFREAVVPFQPGFTGVTGPNGSGKSNISDAVLFVLGTRSSKAIRAERLGDLIYNGGRKGKAARETKVSLVFDNAGRTIPLDTDEVVLTRVVRRSRSNRGQTYSHYYVNGNPSSLTEFEDLLSHARISADGYNIVQQGDVTRIVTMSNLERRRILDEIAGVTRFDADIEHAEKQRVEVEANLDRTRVILREIGSQLKQLAREKERAAEYRTVKEDLDRTRAKLARKRVLALEQELANVHESVASYLAEGEALAGKRADAEAKLTELTTKLAALDAKIGELGGDEARERQEKLQKLREELATARQMRNHFTDEIKGLADDLKNAQSDHKRSEKTLADVVAERNEVAAAIANWKKESARVEGELDKVKESIAAGSTRSHDLQRELAVLKQEHDKLADERHAAELTVRGAGERLERLELELGEAEERLETGQFEAKDLTFQSQETEKAWASLAKTKEAHAKQVFAERKRQAALTEELKKLEPEVRQLQNAYNLAKGDLAAQAHAAGFSRGVEAILDVRDTGRIRGICGTIAELGRPRKGLETALEVAAGGAMQAVVVETDDVAAKCIDLLKADKSGRVTFLPLNKLKAQRPQGKALMAARDPDAIGLAVDLVEFDPKYEAAFTYTFRETLVVSDLTAARRLMGGVRLVTKSGEVIDAGGAITGGTLARERATFGTKRKEDLDKFGSELREKMAEQEALAAELREVTDGLHALHEQLREIDAELIRQETKKGELRRMATEAAERIGVLVQQLEKITAAIDETTKERVKAEKVLATAGKRLDELEGDRETKGKELLRSTAKNLADQLEALRTESDSIKDALRDLAARAEALEEKERLARERRDEFAQRAAELTAKKDEFSAEQAAYKEREAKVKDEIAVLEEVVGAHDSEVKELRDDREGALAARYKAENELARVQDALDANADLVVQFKGRVPVVEDALKEARLELENLPVQAPATVEESQEDLKVGLRNLEGRLQKLEPVNMRALEEYEEHDKRKNELESELERLESEREGLIELADELVGKKKDVLMKVFHEINENFQHTFADLSGGGAAELAFENEVDPFQGGLILRSQPPGKKVQRLEALSGGEKSLTALSFIFAVQLYAPSPFYVLDEVDMFLDGMNSELVASMVRKQSQRAQFVMVSLRKVTLKMADRVYGVTMRDGSSTVLGAVNVDEMTHTEEVKEVAGDQPPA